MPLYSMQARMKQSQKAHVSFCASIFCAVVSCAFHFRSFASQGSQRQSRCSEKFRIVCQRVWRFAREGGMNHNMRLDTFSLSHFIRLRSTSFHSKLQIEWRFVVSCACASHTWQVRLNRNRANKAFSLRCMKVKEPWNWNKPSLGSQLTHPHGLSHGPLHLRSYKDVHLSERFTSTERWFQREWWSKNRSWIWESGVVSCFIYDTYQVKRVYFIGRTKISLQPNTWALGDECWKRQRCVYVLFDFCFTSH